MIQEQTISGGRQSGKSFRAMKLAIEAAALNGERVLFDCDDSRMLAERFEQMCRMAPVDDVVKITRGNGNERINFRGGGQIVMVTRRRGSRGLTADVPIIDHDRGGGEINPTVQRVIRTRLELASGGLQDSNL